MSARIEEAMDWIASRIAEDWVRPVPYGFDHRERVAEMAEARAAAHPSRQVRRAEARARQKDDRR